MSSSRPPPGNLILISFFGTGTTGAVAIRLGPRCLGIERDEGYVRIAAARLASAPRPKEPELLAAIDHRSQPRIPFGWLVERGLLQPGDVQIGQEPIHVRVASIARREADEAIQRHHLPWIATPLRGSR